MIIVGNANTNDRGITSKSSSYSSALSGANLEVTNETYALVGQVRQSGNLDYYIRQYHVEFPYTLPSGQIPVAGHYYFRNTTTYGTNISRDLELFEIDWGETVNTSDWISPSILNSAEVRGISYDSHEHGSNRDLYIGARHVLGGLGSSGTLRYVLASSRNRLQRTPSTGREDNNISQTGATGPSNRPRLVVGAATSNLLHTALAAQIQLSDGSWIVAERPDNNRTPYSFKLRHIKTNGDEGWTWNSANYNFASSDNMRGTHAISLTRDPQDNVYLVHGRFAAARELTLRAFIKKLDGTWSAGGENTVLLPEDASFSNVVSVQMVYHNVAGDGRLVIITFLDWGRLGGTQESYSLIHAGRLRNGSGTLLLNQGAGGRRGFNAYPSNPGRWNPLNPSGTLIDLHVDPFDEMTGYILTAERHAPLGSNASLSMGRYRIHSSFEQFTSNTFSFLDSDGGFATFDPDAKCRVLATDRMGSVAKISADAREGRGLTVDLMNFHRGSNSYVRYNSIRFEDVGPGSIPPGSSLADSMTWDAVYFPPDKSVWIYYLDKDNPRRLMRTAVRVATNQAQQNEVEVVAELAPSGHTIHAIRVQRNRVVSDSVLITASSEDGSGDHYVQQHIDRINVPPTQPTLNPVTNFDATGDKQFTWNFHDPNLLDSQTAYHLEVVDRNTASTVVDTGKISSVNSTHTVTGGIIPNNDDYLWRVKVWDIADEESVWSEYSDFATSDTGIVTIVDPSMDLDPDIFTEDYLLKWEVTEADQEEYRITMIRTLDQSTFLDTGWIESSTDEHLIPLETDVEYLVTVQARYNLVESAPGTRLILSHYSTVEQPQISTQIHDSYINVSVVNPEPRGDRPAPTINRVYRRLAGDEGPFTYMGSCLPNDTFRDYSTASGTIYEYKVRAGVEL